MSTRKEDEEKTALMNTGRHYQNNKERDSEIDRRDDNGSYISRRNSQKPTARDTAVAAVPSPPSLLSSSATSSSLRSLLKDILPSPSVISDRGIFWISLSTDENQLVHKLDRLVQEDWTTTTTTATATTTTPNNAQKQQQNKVLNSFRIVNTHDISNLRSNLPINKLTDVFDKLSDRTTLAAAGGNNCGDECSGRNGIRHLFVKMSVQTESFQRMLHSAVRRGLFSSLTLQGDYRNIAMEVRTIQHLFQNPPPINRGNWYCPDVNEDDEEDEGCENTPNGNVKSTNGADANDTKNKGDFLPHPIDELSLDCMSLNSEVMTILGQYLKISSPQQTTAVHGSDCHRRRHGRTLRSLMLRRTNIENVEALADGIASNDTIEELTISHARLQDDETNLIVDALIRRLERQQQHHHHVAIAKLTKLSLEGNSIGPRTLRALASYLKHPICALEHLNLSHQLSMQPLDEPLPLPPTIKSSFHAFVNELNYSTGSHVKKGDHETSLMSLNLAGNWFTELEMTKIWQCAALLSLENLDLSTNYIKSIADWYFHGSSVVESSSTTAPNAHSHLKRLDLTNNPVWKRKWDASKKHDKAFKREFDAVWDLVETSPHLGYLGVFSCDSSSFLCTTKLQHALNMNKAGRYLWRQRNEEPQEPLPNTLTKKQVDSMMPLVLHRCQRIYGDDTDRNNDDEEAAKCREASASVMFDILRDPIIFDHLISRSRNC